MKKHIAPLSLAALLLTGCGDNASGPAEATSETTVSTSAMPNETPVVSEPSPLPEETTAEAAAVTGPGTYSFETPTGTTGTIAVPGEIPAEIEELRQLVNGPTTTFVTAEVDNRKGAEEFIFYELWAYDPDGVQHTYTDVSEYISELRDLLPEDAPAETYNRFIDASNNLSGDLVQPLQARTILLTGDPVPEEITGVQVSTGFDQVPTVFEQ